MVIVVMVIGGSGWISVSFGGSRWISVVFGGVIGRSRWLLVDFGGSRWISVVLSGQWWISVELLEKNVVPRVNHERMN